MYGSKPSRSMAATAAPLKSPVSKAAGIKGRAPIPSAVGAIPAASSCARPLRHRLGLLLVVALIRHVTCHDDLARAIDARLRVAAGLPPFVGRLHDRQLGVGEVGLRLVRGGLHDRTRLPTPALRPGALPLGFGLLATLAFGGGGDRRLRLQPLHRRLVRLQPNAEEFSVSDVEIATYGSILISNPRDRPNL